MKFVKTRTFIVLPLIVLLSACQKSIEEPKGEFCVVSTVKNIIDEGTTGYPNTHSRYEYDDQQRIIKQMDFETLSGNDTIATIDITYKANEIMVVDQESGGGDDLKYTIIHKLDGDKLVSSVKKHKGIDIETSVYDYNADGTLARLTRNTYINLPNGNTSIIEYLYKDGNCISEKDSRGDPVITYEYYEDKPNPVYLKAFNFFSFVTGGTTPVSKNLVKTIREEMPTAYTTHVTTSFSYDYNSAGSIRTAHLSGKAIAENGDISEGTGKLEFDYKCN